MGAITGYVGIRAATFTFNHFSNAFIRSYKERNLNPLVRERLNIDNSFVTMPVLNKHNYPYIHIHTFNDDVSVSWALNEPACRKYTCNNMHE